MSTDSVAFLHAQESSPAHNQGEAWSRHNLGSLQDAGQVVRSSLCVRQVPHRPLDPMDAIETITTESPPHRTVPSLPRKRLSPWGDWRGVLLLVRRSIPGALVPRPVSRGVGWNDLLFGPHPFLTSFHRRSLFFVRLVHRCRVGGGALECWPPSAAQTARLQLSHRLRPVRMQEKESAAFGSQADAPRTTSLRPGFQPWLRQRLKRWIDLSWG
jgi:hypothetical protein